MEFTIYKIYCKDSSIKDCYVGSTKNLNNRKIKHKFSCNNPNSIGYNIQLYNFIRENGGFDNFEFEEIEKIDNINRFIRERYWIETFNSSLNIKIPTKNKKEHYEANKDKILFQQKANRNVVDHKNYCKKYYHENKDKILHTSKEYYETNKDIIHNYRNTKHICECGGSYTNSQKARHFKSQKHIDYFQTTLISSSATNS